MSMSALIGQDIRALRSARKMTLEELSKRMEKSIGWISQVERDISTPTMSDLRQFADIFEVPISIFFGKANAPDHERGIVVRSMARRQIGAGENGLVETLISPDLTDDFEVIHSIFQPSSKLKIEVKRPTTEVAYLVSGKLDMTIDNKDFTIEAGDSFRIRGETYHWSNPYKAPAVAIWVISPPVY